MGLTRIAGLAGAASKQLLNRYPKHTTNKRSGRMCRLSNPTLALSDRIGYSQNNEQTNHKQVANAKDKMIAS